MPRSKNPVARVITMPAVPPAMLVNCLCEKGNYPRRIALRFMDSPQLVLEATIFYYDCIEAENGDSEAKERIDRVREQVQAMRRAESELGNDPETGPIGPVRGRIGMPEPVPRRGPPSPLSGPPVPSKGELRRLSERKGKIIIPRG